MQPTAQAIAPVIATPVATTPVVAAPGDAVPGDAVPVVAEAVRVDVPQGALVPQSVTATTPGVTRHVPGRWHADVFDCGDDANICCWAYFCYCNTTAQLASKMNGSPFVLVAGVLWIPFICNALLRYTDVVPDNVSGTRNLRAVAFFIFVVAIVIRVNIQLRARQAIKRAHHIQPTEQTCEDVVCECRGS